MNNGAELGNIILNTFILCISSSVISLILGLAIGLLISFFDFKIKKVLIIIFRTLAAVPPVVCGLLCYLLLSGTGPLGFLNMIFTIPGMIFTQVLLIIPLVVATTETFLRPYIPKIRETCTGLQIKRFKALVLVLNESKYSIVSTYLLGLSRSMAEVGAVSMVGGAISWKTNVMTTAIMQFTNMGDYKSALILGAILFAISLLITIGVSIFQMRITKNERN